MEVGESGGREWVEVGVKPPPLHASKQKIALHWQLPNGRNFLRGISSGPIRRSGTSHTDPAKESDQGHPSLPLHPPGTLAAT